MSSNPYEPPRSQPARASASLPRDLGTLTLWTTLIFSLQAVMLLSMGAAGFAGERNPASAEEISAPTLVYGLSVLGFAALLMAGMVVFCLWIYRANVNADALVSSGLEFTPGWAVGWFFVPILNLFKPYQVVSEIYRASDPNADPDYWSLSEVPPYLIVWWLSWLGFNFTANSSSGLFQQGETVRLGGWFGAFQCALGVSASVMVVVLTRAIHRRQKEKARRRSGMH